MHSLTLWIFLCVLLIKCFAEKVYQKSGNVFITISSLKENFIELNWIPPRGTPNETVPFFITLTDTARNEQVIKIFASFFPDGYYRTSISFKLPLPGYWPYEFNVTNMPSGPQCIHYMISSFTYIGEPIDRQCLKIQPTWMYDNREKIGNRRLGNMVIPGTHDSGSYGDIPSVLRSITLTQDKTIYEQLVWGIRYLDLRIGYYPDGFYINHDIVKIMKVKPIFDQIKRFLHLAPREVIILDIHRFPFPSTINSTVLKKFANLLNDEFGSYILPRNGNDISKGPTLDDIWAANKNIIICFADKATVLDSPWLWFPLKQSWADTNKISDLKTFLDAAVKLNYHPFSALMAELTPKPFDIIFKNANLRKMAQVVNGNVTVWVRDEWYDMANIVATDFFLGNNIINTAIAINVNR